MVEYKIIRSEFIDAYGESSNEKYYIKYKKKLLWFEYWTYVKHKEWLIEHQHSVRTAFNSPFEAIEFAEKFIIGNKPYNKHVQTVIKP